MNSTFDHEKLEVYQRAISFNVWVSSVLDVLPKSTSLWSQLDRASASIPLNIAEGNGKWTAKDRCRFFDIARGSALECAAALDISVARGLLESKSVEKGKSIASEIVRMLIGLIKSVDPERNIGKGSYRVGEPDASD